MKRFSLLTCFALSAGLLLVSQSIAGQVFKWVDDKGDTHFSGTIADIPQQYRDQVEEKKYRQRSKSTVKSGSLSGNAGAGRSVSAPQKGGALKRHVVRYKAYEGMASRIIVPVKFNNSVTALMAFDTGAPDLLISSRLAKRLGLYDKNDGMLDTLAGGIGGVIPAIRTIIDSVKVGGAEIEFVPTTITRSISGSFEGLLGMVFVANYSVNIDVMNHVMVFNELPERPNMPAGHSKRWWMSNYYEFSSYRTSWKKHLDSLKNKRGSTEVANQQKIAKRQYRQADKLFRKLERYASQNSVPMHWRKY